MTKSKEFITAKQLIDYENRNHVVSIQPRKHIACIDGFKYYKINSGTLARYRYFKKYDFLVTD